jgi:hypothetical protein
VVPSGSEVAGALLAKELGHGVVSGLEEFLPQRGLELVEGVAGLSGGANELLKKGREVAGGIG